ncbi:MAG: hypothetical protein HQK54_04775 [Oligoflexales bacterium]|nr:hypothetical protein [Oligoflexales bacterium]
MAGNEVSLDRYGTVAIIGTCKNAGKTTVLNHLISKAYIGSKKKLGLTSIGRDGERIDLIFRNEKPGIFVPGGTLLATARSCLMASDVTSEILSMTSISTSLGEVVIARALSAGYVELGGPSIRDEMTGALLLLRNFGADLVLIDGTIDRRTTASPSLADAVILSTSAALSLDPDVIVERTLAMLNLLRIEKLADRDADIKARGIVADSRAGLIDKNGNVVKADFALSMTATPLLSARMDAGTQYVVLGGAVTDRPVMDILAAVPRGAKVTLVVEDGTKLFISDATMHAMGKSGVRLRALDPINVVAMTVNPLSPAGERVDSSYVASRLQGLSGLPVADVMGGRDDIFRF